MMEINNTVISLYHLIKGLLHVPATTTTVSRQSLPVYITEGAFPSPCFVLSVNSQKRIQALGDCRGQHLAGHGELTD